MKRILSVVTALFMLCNIVILPALAADSSVKLTYDLSVNGQNEITVNPGNTIEVVFTVLRTDSDADYSLTAMQNEIMFDRDFFEYVSGSVTAARSEVFAQQLTRAAGTPIIQTSADGGNFGESEVFCTFRLLIRETATGSGLVQSSNAKANERLSGGSAAVTGIGMADLTVNIEGGEPENPEPHAITVTNPTGGTITVSPAGKAAAGETVSLSIALRSGYTLSQWLVRGADGALVYNGALVNGAAFTMPAQAVTVTATLNYSGYSGEGGSSGGTASQITIEDSETPLTGARTPRFEDVLSDHWAFTFVEYLAELGFINGKTKTLYYPGDSITRAEFVTILARMSGESITGGATPFTDVDSAAYYANPVAWAYANGIVNGTSDTTFTPDAKISRQDIAAMIARYVDNRGFSFGKVNAAADFKDSADIADYAAEAVSSMQQANILNGYENGSFLPRGNTTRAEAAKMLALVHNAMHPELIVE